MKKFKFLIATTALAILTTAISAIRLSNDKTPDAGLGIFSFIALSVFLMGLGLLLDLLLAFTKSSKLSVRNHKGFWQIIASLVIFGIIYMIYVLLSS